MIIIVLLKIKFHEEIRKKVKIKEDRGKKEIPHNKPMKEKEGNEKEESENGTKKSCKLRGEIIFEYNCRRKETKLKLY